MEMKLKVARTIDRIMDAAYTYCNSALGDVGGEILSNSSRKVNEDGSISIVYPQKAFEVQEELKRMLDEIYSAKIGLNLRASQLPEASYPTNAKAILIEATQKGLEFNNKVNELIFSI